MHDISNMPLTGIDNESLNKVLLAFHVQFSAENTFDDWFYLTWLFFGAQ